MKCLSRISGGIFRRHITHSNLDCQRIDDVGMMQMFSSYIPLIDRNVCIKVLEDYWLKVRTHVSCLSNKIITARKVYFKDTSIRHFEQCNQ